MGNRVIGYEGDNEGCGEAVGKIGDKSGKGQEGAEGKARRENGKK